MKWINFSDERPPIGKEVLFKTIGNHYFSGCWKFRDYNSVTVGIVAGLLDVKDYFIRSWAELPSDTDEENE